MPETKTKPSFDEWFRIAGIVVRRLTTVATVYRQKQLEGKAGDLDVLIVKLRQTQGENVVNTFSVYAALQTHETDNPKFDELRINGLAALLQETLDKLPEVSSDMQELLQSSWTGDCNGRVASDLFKGEPNTKNEGIGSGNPRDGQLPWAIENLLAQEKAAGERAPRTKAPAPDDEHRRADVARRWGQRNASSLRSAGRIE